MKFDENKKYTNKQIVQAMNRLQQNLASEIGSLGKVIIKIKETVDILDTWKTKTVLEAEIRKELSEKKSGTTDITLNLIKLISVLVGALLLALGYKALA